VETLGMIVTMMATMNDPGLQEKLAYKCAQKRMVDGGDQVDGRENPVYKRSWQIIRCGKWKGMATMTKNLTMNKPR